jgi:hypothetical protein
MQVVTIFHSSWVHDVGSIIFTEQSFVHGLPWRTYHCACHAGLECYIVIVRHWKSVLLLCGISGFRCGVNEVFALLGCYTANIGSYRRFGTYQSHLPRVRKSRNVGQLPIYVA